MSAKIELAFDIPAGDSTGSVSEIATSVGADASPKGSEQRRQSPQGEVGQQRHSHTDLTTLSRVHRIQREIEACRPVSDSDLLQHARDLTGLMEQAYSAYEADRTNDLALEHAKKRLTQRDAARRLLSAEWKAGREAEIAAACGAGWFMDQGDKDRAQIAANEGKAA